MVLLYLPEKSVYCSLFKRAFKANDYIYYLNQFQLDVFSIKLND